MKIEVKDGKVSLQIDGSFTAEQLTNLVQQIGQARGEIAQDPMTLDDQNIPIPTAIGASFWTQFDPEKNLTVLFYRNVGLGWMGVTFTPEHVALLISLWSQQLLQASPTPSNPAAATSNDQQGRGGGHLH